MRILDEGNWKEPWKAEVLCLVKGCGAKLELEESDLKPTGYKNHVMANFECPICKNMNSVENKLLSPRLIKKFAQELTQYYNSCSEKD